MPCMKADDAAAVAVKTPPHGPAAPAVAKYIDWYCQECPIDFLDASTPGARPDLVDGIIPCCGSVGE